LEVTCFIHGMVIGLQITDELPIEIECFLLNLGFFEPTRAPRSGRNAPVHIAEKVEQYKAWKPIYDGEDPPF
jgi:hypothetical protein